MAHPHLRNMEESPPPGPQPPPNAMFCHRVYARDQPPNLQAAFTEFYPNGLPNVYKMLQTPGAEGVPQTYVEDYLPVGFYTQPRPQASAIFSTQNGQRPFRQMQHLLPQRRIHLWSRDEIQSVCNSLRKLYWNHMKGMQQPFCWDNLWEYFDAFDLYHYGALNLWNVVNQLFDENKTIYADVIKEFAVHIGRWADEWLRSKDNKTKLLSWHEIQGPLLRILSPEDWTDIGDVPDDAVPMLANALKHRRRLMLTPASVLQDAKPTHLSSACLRNSLENWLAGQRVFTPAGLPSPPEVRSHHCSPASKEAPAPVTMYEGNHYYLPPGMSRSSSAVEKLQQSAAAAGPVIAHGSSKTAASSSDGSSHTLQVSPETRSKSTEPMYSYYPLTVTKSVKESDAGAKGVLSNARDNGSHVGENEDDEYSEFAALTPTKIRRRGRDNPRSAQGVSKTTVTASLPASAVMGFSELAGPSDPDTAQATSAPTKENRTPRPNKNKKAELPASHGKEQKKGQRSSKSGSRSGNHDSAGTRTLVNGQQRSGSGPHAVAGASGKQGYQVSTRTIHPQAPSGLAFHQAGVSVAHDHQRSYSGLQQHPDAFIGMDYRHQMPQLQSALPKGFVAHGGRGSSISSRFEQNENQWPHQHRPENFNNVPLTPNRGGFYRGGARRGGNHRGSNNQRNVTAPAVQHQVDHGFNQKRRDGMPWNNNQWRRQGSNSNQSFCPNAESGIGAEYVPCSCQLCNARNRSIHVKVDVGQDRPGLDLVMRIKLGLGARYGIVEEVFAIPAKDPGHFIARFRDEQAVRHALTIGGGYVVEKGITIRVSPAVRSKWASLLPSNNPGAAIPPLVQASMAMGFPSHPVHTPMVMSHPGALPASHAISGPIYSAASSMQMMAQEFVPPPFFPHDMQFARGPPGFVRPPFLEQPHTGTQPATQTQRFRHQEQMQISAPFHTAPLVGSSTAEPEKNNGSPAETLQSKPPSEEALDEAQDIEQDGFTSPQSNKSKGTGVKARVSLPNTPPKYAQSPQAQPTVHTPPRPSAEAIPGSIEKQPCDDTKVGTESETQAGVETTTQPKSPLEPGESGPTNHARVPSIFTEDQIKERRQAWAKISMPLNPHKSKPASPTKSHSPVTKDGGSPVPQCDRPEANIPNESEMSSPTQPQMYTPETGSVYEPSPERIPNDIAQCAEKEDRPVTPSNQAGGSETVSNGRLGKSIIQPAPQLEAPSAEEVISTKEGTAKRMCKGGVGSMTTFQPDNTPDASTETQSRWKSKKSKRKKKGKQNGDSQINTSRPPLPQAWTGFQGSYGTTEPAQSMTVPGPSTRFGGQASGSPPSGKKHHDDGNQSFSPGSTKRTKKYDSNLGPAHDNQAPPPWAFDESGSPEEGVRGRKGFREGRGGSLRMGKQRRPRAIMPQSTLAEQHLDNQASSPSSDFVFENPQSPVPDGSSSLTNGTKTGTKSRLNPKAQEFVSPSRPTGDGKADSSKSSPLKDLSIKSRENSFGPRGRGEESPEIGADNHEAFPHGANDLTAQHHRALSESTKKENRNNEAGAHGEGKKTAGKGKKPGKGKDRAVTLGAKMDDKAGAKLEKKQPAPQTPDDKGKNKKPGLVVNEDWPSLPGPRDRALSKPQTPSVWSAKKKATSTGEECNSGQGSPKKKV
ncbi:hypothetical protein CDV31_003560 [Fusarium ambrosium]|uniref:RRM domain-containing protein n=1 Tax=Fusarium ambrosium TaxID=131363 RepID=A0A428UTM5_9HYPO|nr:hypothetical protein CDV31_003560 [Fusarium ambrosium]